jgi:hypothetical protein
MIPLPSQTLSAPLSLTGLIHERRDIKPGSRYGRIMYPPHHSHTYRHTHAKCLVNHAHPPQVLTSACVDVDMLLWGYLCNHMTTPNPLARFVFSRSRSDPSVVCRSLSLTIHGLCYVLASPVLANAHASHPLARSRWHTHCPPTPSSCVRISKIS